MDHLDPAVLERERRQAYRTLIDSIGHEHVDRDGLLETPARAAKAWAELTSGYDADIGSMLKTFDSDGYDEMVAVADIPFASLCEHHMLPFTGKAHVVYIPNGRIVGLSKIPRLVDAFSHRLQVQERLTIEIADALHENLEPVGILVLLEATHMCATLRGVKKSGTVMRTSALRGLIKEDAAARAEALALIRNGR